MESPSAFHRKNNYSLLFFVVRGLSQLPFPQTGASEHLSRNGCQRMLSCTRFPLRGFFLWLTFYTVSSRACCWLAAPSSSYSARSCVAIWKTTCLRSGHCHHCPRDDDLPPTKQTSPRDRASVGIFSPYASHGYSVKCHSDFIKSLCKFGLHGWTCGSYAQVSPMIKRLEVFLSVVCLRVS